MFSISGEAPLPQADVIRATSNPEAEMGKRLRVHQQAHPSGIQMAGIADGLMQDKLAAGGAGSGKLEYCSRSPR
jgi:hypothetical protein